MSDKTKKNFPGKKANVAWDSRLCIHIGECGRAKGDLFVGGRKPWCDPDLASDDEIADVVTRCPSGALSFEFEDGSRAESPPPVNTVSVSYNGPLFAHGDLQIEGAGADRPGLRFRAALCRCGESKSKPFCDNSHVKSGFSDFGAVGESGSGHGDAGGPLAIRPAKDGPLLVKGNVTIRASSGRTAWTGKQAALCRCGGSNNKPFCDGTHKTIGFRSE